MSAEQIKKINSIKTTSIIATILLFTIIGIIASTIMALIDSISILTTTWDEPEVEKDKTLWGVLGITILGPIATLIFSIQALKVVESKNKIFTGASTQTTPNSKVDLDPSKALEQK
ncbi:MAG: hypothetical protein ACRC4L_00320 [Mycoplasma sp.]